MKKTDEVLFGGEFKGFEFSTVDEDKKVSPLLPGDALN